MNEVSYKEYIKAKREFYLKHSTEFAPYEVRDSVGVANHKAVHFDDGASWHETTEPVTEMVVVSLHGECFEEPVDFYRTEFWNSEDGISSFLYERA